MTTQDTTSTEPQLDEEQQLEWGNTPLKAEDRDAVYEGVPTEEDEGTEEVDDTEESEDDEEELEELEDEEVEASFNPVELGEDPGEYVPEDFSFSIELDGKTHKISTPEEATEFADENAEKLTAKQLLGFMRQSTKMEDKIERHREAWEKAKSEYDEQKSLNDAQIANVTNIANEINYLVNKGKLPKVDPKYANTDWSNPTVAKQAGVKEQVELLEYMRKENAELVKAGLPPMTSPIAAFNAMELERRDNQEEDAEKVAGAKRQKASGRVASAAAKPVNVKPKGVAVGRAFNLSDLDSM
jgi:hypothetical protein